MTPNIADSPPDCIDCGDYPADPARSDRRCPACGHEIDRMYETLCGSCGDVPASDSRDDGLCDACARKAWLEATEDWLRATAEANGWSCRLTSAAATGSSYYTLQRTDEAADRLEEITVRVSDHPSLYCSEDFSLSMVDGGDDSTREAVAARLARPIAS